MKDISKLQKDFIEKINKGCSFTKVKTINTNPNTVTLFIASKHDKKAEKEE